MLAEARARIVRHTPEEAADDPDLLLVDLRAADERARAGVIPGSKHVPYSVLQWRADQTSESRDEELAGRRLCLVCAHGYSSSLAAASLVELGIDAGDLVGGYEGWVEAGLPVKEAVPAGASQPDVSQWEPWRPEQVAELLADVDLPWYVAAGWAIDLFLGGERREHGDIEVAVPNTRFDELAGALAGLEVFVITPPLATPLAEGRDRLVDTHQTWVRDPSSGKWRLDLFREPSDGDDWICRREPAIRLPYDDVIEWTDDGIPYGRPEIVLLFKARHAAEAKNQGDFEAVLPRLDASRREWLRATLERVHPGHPWLARLERAPA
jgi:rhodanese-related sulfurtransferase